MEDDTTLPTAALRDFRPVCHRYGSTASGAISGSRRCISAVPPEA